MVKLLKKRWYLFLLLPLLVVIFLNREMVIKPDSSKEKTYKVVKQTLKEETSFSGEIGAEEKTVLRFQTSGMLAWVGVKEGDAVKKYQTIASLDQRELKKRLEKQLKSYLNTRWDFEQTKDDYDSTVITTAIQRVLDQSQFSLDSSVLDVELQNLTLQFANLFSPIEGIVTRVTSPFVGVNITPSQAEFEIVNPKTIYFSALVDQTDVVNLSVGKKGEIVFDAFPDEKITGIIRSISYTPKAGESGTVYQVKIDLSPTIDSARYKLGMTGDFSVVLKEKNNVLTVPLSALKTENEKTFVYKKEGDEKKKIFIETGEETNEDAEVKHGLAPGDVIFQ